MHLPEIPVNNRYRILVVEDDPAILKLISIQMNAAGFECVTAIDGIDGMRKCVQNDPHLVVTDINLPGFSGHELVEKIRHTSAVPVIMITATNSDESQMKGFKVGADDYIPKPFNPNLLMARIVANLRRVYRYGVDATPKAPTPTPAPELKSSVVPPGWIKCDSCGYIGPQDRFQAEDFQGNRIMQCPNCRNTDLTFSLM